MLLAINLSDILVWITARLDNAVLFVACCVGGVGFFIAYWKRYKSATTISRLFLGGLITGIGSLPFAMIQLAQPCISWPVLVTYISLAGLGVCTANNYIFRGKGVDPLTGAKSTRSVSTSVGNVRT